MVTADVDVLCVGRSLWQQKKKEDDDMSYREREEAKEFSKMRMFGRPGHGAPTIDNRKKRSAQHSAASAN